MEQILSERRGDVLVITLKSGALRVGYEGDHAAAMVREADDRLTMRGTADAVGGGRAFVEKRIPQLQGR